MVFAIFIGLRLSNSGAFQDPGRVDSLVSFWIAAAFLIGLGALARLMFGALVDVRQRGLGAPLQVSPIRQSALRIAEASYLAMGPAPAPQVEVPVVAVLARWTVPVRTPEFIDTAVSAATAPVDEVEDEEKLPSLSLMVDYGTETKTAVW